MPSSLHLEVIIPCLHLLPLPGTHVLARVRARAHTHTHTHTQLLFLERGRYSLRRKFYKSPQVILRHREVFKPLEHRSNFFAHD